MKKKLNLVILIKKVFKKWKIIERFDYMMS